MRLQKEQTDASLNWVELYVDPKTGRRVDIPDSSEEGMTTPESDESEAEQEIVKSDVLEEETKVPEHETIRVCLRYLRVQEINDMQNKVYNINAEMRGRRTATVKSEFNYGLYMERKMETAIVAWENVQDEKGKPAKVTVENIRLLPGWIGVHLIEVIDEMNDMGTEILGE